MNGFMPHPQMIGKLRSVTRLRPKTRSQKRKGRGMTNSSEAKRQWTPAMIVLWVVIIGLVAVLLISVRTPELMTCHSVEEDGSPALTCTTITHTRIIRGRSRGPYRVTQFADVSALNPGSTVMASIELSDDNGNATVQFMYEPDRWASISTRMRSMPNASVNLVTEVMVINNRVEFILDGVRNVRLHVRFRNPVAPDEDDITVTQMPVLSIVGDGEQGILFTQEPFMSIVGDGDGASGTQEAFMIIVGDDDEASGTQEAVAPTQP